MDLPSMVQRVEGGNLVVRSVVSGSPLYQADQQAHGSNAMEEVPTNLDANQTPQLNANPQSHLNQLAYGGQTSLPDQDLGQLPQCKIKRNYSCNHCEFFTQNPRNHLTHLRDVHGEKIIINECKLCLYASRHFQKLVRHMKMVHGCTDGFTSATGQGSNRGKRAGVSREVRKRMLEESVSGNGGSESGTMSNAVWPSLKQMRQELHLQEQQLSREIANFKKCEEQEIIDSSANLFALAFEIQQKSQFQQPSSPVADALLAAASTPNVSPTTIVAKEVSPTDAVDRFQIAPPENMNIPATALTQQENDSQISEKIASTATRLAAPSPKRLLKCKLCSFRTLLPIELTEHEVEQHGKTMPFRCENCNYETPIKARFRKHVKYHTMPMIKCANCDFRSPYKWNLDRHTRNHGTDGRYKCTVCDFSADIKQSLTIHELHHHEPPVDNSNHAATAAAALRRRSRMPKPSAWPAVKNEYVTGIHEQQGESSDSNGTSDDSERKAQSEEPQNMPQNMPKGVCENLKVGLKETSNSFQNDTDEDDQIYERKHLELLSKCEATNSIAKELPESTQFDKMDDEPCQAVAASPNGDSSSLERKSPNIESESETMSTLNVSKSEQNLFYGVETAPGYGEITKKLPTDMILPNAILKRVYKCPDCTFWAATASRFHVHIVGHLNKKPFECSQCSYRSNWRWDITKHIRLKAVRDVLHRGSKVLMNDETGRRNYTKYNKYITQIRLTGDLSDPKVLRTGEMLPEQMSNLSYMPKTEDVQDVHNGTISMPFFKDDDSANVEDDFLTDNDLDYAEQQNTKSQGSPAAPSAHETEPAATASISMTKPTDDLITEVHLENNIKKSFYRCRRCNFRHENRDAVLVHVGVHYPEPMAKCGASNLQLKSVQILTFSKAQTHDQAINDTSNLSVDAPCKSRNDNVQTPPNLPEPQSADSCEILSHDEDSASNSITQDTTAENDIICEEQRPLKNFQEEQPGPPPDSAEAIIICSTNNIKDSIQTPYRCGHCQQGSNWKHVIQRHCRLKHDGDVRIEIVEQSSNSSNESEKNVMQNRMEVNEMSLVPAENVSNLITEQTASTTNKNRKQKCAKCEYIADTKLQLKQHMATHKLKQYQCSLCDFACSKKQDINMHLRAKHQLKGTAANVVASQAKVHTASQAAAEVSVDDTGPKPPQKQHIRFMLSDNDGIQEQYHEEYSTDQSESGMEEEEGVEDVLTTDDESDIDDTSSSKLIVSKMSNSANGSSVNDDINEAAGTRVYHRVVRGNLAHSTSNNQNNNSNIILVNAKTGEVVARK